MRFVRYEINGLSRYPIRGPYTRTHVILDKMRGIYWSLGYEKVEDGMIEKFLNQHGWLVKET
jgi:hypothetical protein